VKTYSSGMYARLAFSASIFVDPEILIIDEILAVGDAPFQAKCLKAFHSLRDGGCTILIVAHDAYMIKNFCQRAVYLRKGELISVGKSAEVVDLYSVEVESALAANNAVPREDQPVAHQADAGVGVFRVTGVELLGADGEPASVIRTGDGVTVRFRYRSFSTSPVNVTFVANLYRHDGLYICGTTSLMDGEQPFAPGGEGEVCVSFPSLPLLAGRYIWRVAINDERAFGIYAEANQVCPFEVKDHLESVGLVHLPRHWSVTTRPA
jgi:hypothetical protein